VDQINGYAIGICCLPSIYVAFGSKEKHWLAWRKETVAEWSDMFTSFLLFQWASTANSTLYQTIVHLRDYVL